MEKYEYRCANCGSNNLDIKVWFNQITENIEYLEDYKKTDYDVYCLNCEELVSAEYVKIEQAQG